MTRKQKLVQVKINTAAIAKYVANFKPGSNLQKFIDQDAARVFDPYVPSDTAAIRRSVFINTDFGSGRLVYTIYGNPKGWNTWNGNNGTAVFQGAPKRGAYWTSRALADGGMEKLKLSAQRFVDRS